MLMKKEIRLMLDYQCYPIWIYDENGKFIDNDLIDEIEEDNNVITMLEKLQDRFDSLYVNNKNEFKYVGFSSSEDKKKIEKEINHVYIKLCDLLSEKYIINNMININEM